MKFTEEEMDAYFYGPTPEDWPIKCIAMFEQMRDERDELRARIEKLETRESKLVWLISDGKLSKPGYDMSVLESELDETIQKYAEKGAL